jgi:poly(A) polymerase
MKKDYFTFFEVGGKVRDELLGLPNKDVDYVAVPSESLLSEYNEPSDMFNLLDKYLTDEKFEIFLKTPNCYTIRARFPAEHKYNGVADFVMARKEIGYISDTRTPVIVPGTLYDDLERRDFTVNALAKDSNGNIIDYFNGIEDLKSGIIRTPLNCNITFEDDPLRILRAIRFSITKNFSITNDIQQCIEQYDYFNKMTVVSKERVREELYKCFKFDTLKTLSILNKYSALCYYIFAETNLWLKPTNEG